MTRMSWYVAYATADWLLSAIMIGSYAVELEKLVVVEGWWENNGIDPTAWMRCILMTGGNSNEQIGA